jgi:hypothetical protein
VAKKELAPLKTTVTFDPEIELARVDAELSTIDVKAKKLTQLALIVALAGLGITAAVTVVFWLIYGWIVLWGGPAAVLGAALGGWLLLQCGKLRARAEFLMKQRRETKSLQKRAELKARG